MINVMKLITHVPWRSEEITIEDERNRTVVTPTLPPTTLREKLQSTISSLKQGKET